MFSSLAQLLTDGQFHRSTDGATLQQEWMQLPRLTMAGTFGGSSKAAGLACLHQPAGSDSALVVVMSLPTIIGTDLVGQRGDSATDLAVIGTSFAEDVAVWAMHKVPATKLEELKAANPMSTDPSVFVHGAPATTRLGNADDRWELRVDVGDGSNWESMPRRSSRR